MGSLGNDRQVNERATPQRFPLELKGGCKCKRCTMPVLLSFSLFLCRLASDKFTEATTLNPKL